MTHAPKTAPCGCLSCALERALRRWGRSRKADDPDAATSNVLEQIGFFAGNALGGIAVVGRAASVAEVRRMNSAYERGFHRGVTAGSDGQIEMSSTVSVTEGDPHGRPH